MATEARIPACLSLPQQVLGRGQGTILNIFALVSCALVAIKNRLPREIAKRYLTGAGLNTPNSAATPNKPPILPKLPTNYNLIMQNKANFPDTQMNVNKVLSKDYENISNWKVRKNKANSKPNKPNLSRPNLWQSWGCFDLIGRATPKTFGLSFSLADLKYYCRIADKNTRALTSYF